MLSSNMGARQSERTIQLELQCRSCGLAGLTPEVSRLEAVHLVRGELEIRCPKCGAILTIITSELEILARSPGVSLIQKSREFLEQALNQELKDRDED